MNNSFSSIITEANSILILLPKNPYFDQVAAGLGLYLSLRGMKDTSVVSQADMTVHFNRLIGVNKVSSELGNKNLVMRFTNYDGNGIERVSADLENGVFNLTVIPKPGVPSPKKENVSFGYSGVSCDLAILMGGANESHFPSLVSKDLAGVKLMHFGTKQLQSSKQIINFVHPASSISEIVAAYLLSTYVGPQPQGGANNPEEQISQSPKGFPIDADVATNLLMGIEQESKGFTSQEVTSETFHTIADLMSLGGQRSKAEVKPQDFPQGAVPQAPPKVSPKVQPQPHLQTQVQTRPQQQVKPVSQQQTQQSPNPAVQTPQGNVRIEEPPTPQDWLKPPKVFKGTSVS